MKKSLLLLLFSLTFYNIFSQTITSVSPNNANQGTILSVSISGSNTHFGQGTNTTQVWFRQGTSTIWYPTSTNVINTTQLTAQLTVASNRPIGFYDVYTYNSLDGTIMLNNGFSVNPDPDPASLVSITPNTTQRGEVITVSLSGQYTHFGQGTSTTQVWIKQGIQPSLYSDIVTVTNTQLLSAQFSIPSNIPLGYYNVYSNNSVDGTLSILNGMNITADLTPPSIISVTPGIGQQGQTLSVAISGQYTHFGQGTNTTQIWFKQGTSTTMYPYSVSVSSPTQAIVNLNIPANQNLGMYDTYVSNNIDGTLIKPSSFEVYSCTAYHLYTSGINPACYNECNGSVDVGIVSGHPPYTYQWNLQGQLNNNISNLCFGTYFVTVTDNVGCSGTASYTLTNPAQILINMSSVSAICNQSNGAAQATVSGGMAPYSYVWSNGQTSSSVNNIAAGIYTITVTDSRACSASSVVAVNNVNGPGFSMVQKTDVLCNNEYTGAVNITLTGGVLPYTYIWSNGATTEDISGIHAGSYDISVTDYNGCVASTTVQVNEASLVTATVTATPATCGGSNGSATAIVNGGTPPYFFLWSNGLHNSSISNLSPAVYYVTVSDLNNCSTNSPVFASVGTINGPVVTTDNIVNTSCGNASGSVDITVSSGTFPYSYIWSNGATTEDISALSTGNYQLTVTDYIGCEGSQGIVIENELPQTPQICMATVDIVLNKIIVLWDYAGSSAIDHFNIYRESSIVGSYSIINSVLYNSTGTNYSFMDAMSYPDTRAYRYKISVVDTCGSESILSTEHMTMYLSVSSGGGNFWNLTWNDYFGFNVNQYYIYRADQYNNWAVLDSISSVFTTYSDLVYSNTYYKYAIGVEPFQQCNPAKSLNSLLAYSNMANNGIVNAPDINLEKAEENISVFPNPFTLSTIISFNNKVKEKLTLSVRDITGKIVLAVHDITDEKYILDRGNLQSGLYFIEISGNKKHWKKIVVE